MKPVVLVVRDREGEPRPAVRSIFPAHETDLQASSFRSIADAERFAEIMRDLGIAPPALEILTRWSPAEMDYFPLVSPPGRKM